MKLLILSCLLAISLAQTESRRELDPVTTEDPVYAPTLDPTLEPSLSPTFNPTMDPTMHPTLDPTTSDACTASDCNDRGTASGNLSDEGGCQCTCDAGFTGDACQEDLKIKQEVSFTGTTKAAVEANAANYTQAYANAIGKDVSKVTILEVVETTTRRRLVTEVSIVFEVLADDITERNEVTATVSDTTTFQAALASEVVAVDNSVVVQSITAPFEACSRSADCSGNGSTTVDDNREDCQCTCDAGWDSSASADCSVPLSQSTDSDDSDDFLMIAIIILAGAVVCLGCAYFYTKSVTDPEDDVEDKENNVQLADVDAGDPSKAKEDEPETDGGAGFSTMTPRQKQLINASTEEDLENQKKLVTLTTDQLHQEHFE